MRPAPPKNYARLTVSHRRASGSAPAADADLTPAELGTDRDVLPIPPGYRALNVVPGIFSLLGCSALARTATRTYQVTLILFVLAVYHSPSLSGLILLASQVPGLAVSPIAGALLDRRGRRALIAIDFLTAASALVLIVVLGALGDLPRWGLFVIVIAASFTQPLSSTGTRSMFPVIVPRHLWDRANGLDGSTFVIANVFGPTLAGFGAAIVGSRYALLLPVVLYLVAASLLYWVRAPEPARASTPLLSDALGALRYVFTHKTLRQLSGLVTVYVAGVGTMNIAIPVLVLDHLHGGTTTTGLMLAVLGLGGSISSIAMGRIGTVGREHWLMSGGALVAGGLIAACAFAVHSEALGFVLLLLVGLTNGPVNITMFTVRQRVTDPEWFGRAFAISMSLNGAGIPTGAAITGLLISHSIVVAFLVGGAVTAAAAIWSIISPFEETPRAAPHQVELHTAAEVAQ